MKTVVTHIHPDMDAISSTWLVKRFMPGWEDAGVAFVSAGLTFKGEKPDDDEDIIHVDTGLGQFDHHQTNAHTSATKKVFQYLCKHNHIPSHLEDPLEKLVAHVTDVDHFAEVNFPNPTSDMYEFNLSQMIEGLNATLRDPIKVVEHTFVSLDAILQLFVNKQKAQEEIKKGFVFQTAWGKTVAMETKNEESMKLALKMGYALVIRRDPDYGNIRIKSVPSKEINLGKLHKKLLKADPKATWFLHSSKNILLNGSSKGPNMVPTVLPIKKVIEIVKEMK